MERTIPSVHVYRFGLFEADVARATLTRNGMRVKIQDQPFRVLVFLLERPGEILTREELRHKLWPEGTFVDFDGSLNVILKKLRAAIDDDSDNPRFIETIPRRGYRFIAPVLPVRTAQVVGTVSEELPAAAEKRVDQKSASYSTSAPIPKSGTPRNGILFYVTAGLAILIGLGVWSISRGTRAGAGASTTAAPSRVARNSVAVIGFRNLSGNAEDAWLGTALSEMLSTELAGGEQLRLVSGEDVANLRISSPWSQSGTLDQATTSRIGAALGGDLLVLGSYTTVRTSKHVQLRLDVRLQDARTGEILSEIAETGGTEDLFELVLRVGVRLRDRLGIPGLKGGDEAEILAALPLNPDAARFYAMGVAKLRQYDALAAKDLLLQTVKADPKFCLGHAMLARAWGHLGYDQNHRDEAKKALDLSTDLSRANKMLVEGEYYESMGQHEQAASVYDALFELFPDNVDYGLRFVNAQVYAGNASKALKVIARLRSLPPALSADPRIDLAESAAIKVNKAASLVLIQSAVKKASAQGKTPIYALARKDECVDLLYAGPPEVAVPVCEDAYNVFLESGNRAGAADAVRMMADVQGAQGHYGSAIATYERALNLLSGLGEHAKTGAILNNMAINYANQGKVDQAEEFYRQAKLHFEEAGEKVNIVTANTNIADIQFSRGNLAAAERTYHRSLELLATIEHSEDGYDLFRLADVELARGDLSSARSHAQDAVESYRSTQGSFQYLTGAMMVLGRILLAQGDINGARAQFEEALSIRHKIGESDLAAETDVELANLSIEEAKPEGAVAPLRAAIATFEKEKADPDASNAYMKLSRALLGLGKIEEARAAVERAVQLSHTSADPALELPATIQKVRVDMASTPGTTSLSAALQQLRAAGTTARRLGYYNIECDVRLYSAQLQMQKNPSSARTQLAALAADARSHGYNLVARRAEMRLSDNVLAQSKLSR